MLSYKGSDLLILENRGRYMYLSRYDKNNALIWSKKLKADRFFSQEAQQMAVVENGNIAITSNGKFLFENTTLESAYQRDVISILNENGTVLKDIAIFGLMQYNGLLSDDSNFFVLAAEGSNTYIQKVDETGVRGTATISLTQSGILKSANRMANKSNNELVVIGDNLEYAIINKATMAVKVEPKLTNDFSNARELVVRNDTLYASAYNSATSYTSLICYSLTAKRILWSKMKTSTSGGTFQKLSFDNKGYLYAMGIGQYNGFLLQKINAKYGSVQWQQLYTYAQDIEAAEMHYDAFRDEVIVTGYKTVAAVNYPTNATFSSNGALISLITDSSMNGSGNSIGQSGNGTLLIGSHTVLDNTCSNSSVIKQLMSTTAIRPANVAATDGNTNGVMISWDMVTPLSYSRVYRSNTNNSSAAQPISGWITGASYTDETAQIATPYFYFLRAALSDTGNGISVFSISDEGHKGIPIPNLLSLITTNDHKLNVSWSLSEGATFYRLSRNNSDNPATAIPVSTWTNANSFTDLSAVAGISYYYYIQAAKNNTGLYATPLSSPISGGALSLAPMKVSATDGEPDQITVTWTYPSPSYFKVYRSFTSDFKNATAISGWISSLHFTDNTTEIAIPYYYYVTASSSVTGMLESPDGVADSGYRGFAVPQILEVEPVQQSLNIKWTSTVGASAYNVFRGTSENSLEATSLTEWKTIDPTSGYTDTSIEPGITYTYFVKAAKDNAGKYATILSGGKSGRILVTSIEATNEQQLIAYPNPATDKVTLKLISNYIGIVTIECYDWLGRKLAHHDFTKTEKNFEQSVAVNTSASGVLLFIIHQGAKKSSIKIKKL